MKKKASNQVLTLEQLEKSYQAVKEIKIPEYFVVSPTVAKTIDLVWDKLPWYVKVWINLKRLFNGVGLYKKAYPKVKSLE